MNLRKDHYRETSLILASPISKNNSHFARPFLSPFREGVGRGPTDTRAQLEPVNLGRAIRAVPAAAFRRRDEPPGPATSGLTTPTSGAVSRLRGLAARPGRVRRQGKLGLRVLHALPALPANLYFRNTFPGVRQPMFHGWQVQELKSKKITILGGGSLGSCVDEERSQLRELM